MLSKNDYGQRRTSMEITAEILRLARKGARKTRVVYGANINFKILDKYLERLIKTGLLAKQSYERGILKTSEKGEEFLKKYTSLKDFVELV